MTTVYRIDPLTDPRWAEFVTRHQRASVFHSVGWLDALRQAYGYRPVVYTTAAPGHELTDGLVACQVQSRITGRRLVSLPFSDHCEPLVEGADTMAAIAQSIERERAAGHYRYVEIRPRTAPVSTAGPLAPVQTFFFHTLDLKPELTHIFAGLHKNCVRRKIQRSEREQLTFEEGSSEMILGKFYHLLLLTCRRRRLPPRPRAWFRSLLHCLGHGAKIRVASHDGQPIASILTLTFENAIVYKYGCSDERFHNLGGMQALLWRAILEGKAKGMRELDLGRSDLHDHGLVTFKDRWGTTRSELTYWRTSTQPARPVITGWRMRIAMNVFAHLPMPLLRAAGNFLYRHVG